MKSARSLFPLLLFRAVLHKDTIGHVFLSLRYLCPFRCLCRSYTSKCLYFFPAVAAVAQSCVLCNRRAWLLPTNPRNRIKKSVLQREKRGTQRNRVSSEPQHRARLTASYVSRSIGGHDADMTCGLRQEIGDFDFVLPLTCSVFPFSTVSLKQTVSPCTAILLISDTIPPRLERRAMIQIVTPVHQRKT